MHMKALSGGKVKRPKITADVPPSIAPIVEACWQQEPASRPTFPKVRDLLAEALSSSIFSKEEESSEDALNAPGRWDVFLSHTQRHADGKLHALDLYVALTAMGYSVWLDVKVSNQSIAAMEEGVRNSKCVVAVITGPCIDLDNPDKASTEEQAENAYFNRWMCQQELRWAVEAGVPIQPVVRIKDKGKIGDFIQMAPDDLKFIGNTNWEDLNRSNSRKFQLGVEMVMEQANAQIAKAEKAREQARSAAASAGETKSSAGSSAPLVDRALIEQEMRERLEKEYEEKRRKEEERRQEEMEQLKREAAQAGAAARAPEEKTEVVVAEASVSSCLFFFF